MMSSNTHNLDSVMAPTRLADISQAQQERLSHIDFRLRFLGTIGRNDLVSRFGIKAAAATRDITLYKELASQNLEYDTKAKIYTRSEPFSPLFDYSRHQALTALAHGFGDDFVAAHKAHIACDTPAQLNKPQLDTLSVLTRAIHQKQPVEITYRSLSSGRTTRQIAPFVLVDNGLRWHVRAYDRKRARFTDFVINRISEPSLISNSWVEEHETKDNDIQWNRIVELEIVPHPRVPFPETIEHEYDMVDGTLHVNVRAAVAGYVLRRWNVDCSEDHSLDGPEYHLWLKNRQALYGVENLVIAPGYNKNEEE
jgi:predicted DNA-binding transcriptional regulator YafY